MWVVRGRRKEGGWQQQQHLEKKSQTWKTGPISGVPEEAYRTSQIRAREEVSKISHEIVGKV